MVNENVLEKEYGLKNNPFFDSSRNVGVIDRTEIRNKLSGTFKQFFGYSAPEFLFITGQYGVGKSTLLMEINKEILAENKEYFEKGLVSAYFKAIPPKVPSDYILYLYSSLVSSLKKTFFEEIRNKLSNITKNSTTNTNDIKTAILKLNDTPLAWKYLCATNLSKSELSELGVSKNIEDNDSAENSLVSLLEILFETGYKQTILLIDEFENIFTLTGGKKAAQILLIFREIFDRITTELKQTQKSLSQLIFVFASSSATTSDLQKLMFEYEGVKPFYDRILQKAFVLPGFSRDDTKQLIIKYLKSSRNKDIANDLFPFKDDYIDWVQKVSQGIPRFILQYSGIILDSATDRKLKEISESDAKTIYSEESLI